MKEFFSCDWGTSSFRLRRVSLPDGKVLSELQEPAGVRFLSSQCDIGDVSAREKIFTRFLTEKLRLLGKFNGPIHVAISGMASSSVGWRELPYGQLGPLDGSSIRFQSFDLESEGGCSARVHLISGLSTKNEIMRGEETEILGVFSNGAFMDIAADGKVVLPGTHSKHVRVLSSAIESFSTYMTGELFDVIAKHSLLRASVAESAGDFRESRSREAFGDGVAHAREPGLMASLFQVRTRTVLSGVSPVANSWFLSGLLIGAELEDLVSRHRGLPILLAATEPLSSLYQLAFQTIGLSGSLTIVPPDEMKFASLRGHLMLLKQWGIA